MTPNDLAQLHARSFTTPRPWQAEEFADLLASERCFLLAEPQGFVLGRVIADEAELLTVAVAPEARRRGTGARLVAAFAQAARARGAVTAFLEVAEGNVAARALYDASGWAESGRRRAYYHHPDGSAEDALVMVLPLAAPAV